MKRFAALLLLTLYLFFGTGFNQLLKLPALISHFKEHQAASSGLSFFEFLHMHYAGDDHNDKDQDRDMQLPFKSNPNFASNTFEFTAVNQQQLVSRVVYVYTEKIRAFSNEELPSHHPSSIWQPPEFC